MEHYKISKLLDDLTVLKFVKRRWIELNDLSNGQCSFNKKAQSIGQFGQMVECSFTN